MLRYGMGVWNGSNGSSTWCMWVYDTKEVHALMNLTLVITLRVPFILLTIKNYLDDSPIG